MITVYYASATQNKNNNPEIENAPLLLQEFDPEPVRFFSRCNGKCR
jgi:hypothetical protein